MTRDQPRDEGAAHTALIMGVVKRLRVGKGWSAQRLAEEMTAAGVPWNTDIVVNLEHGRRKSLRVHELVTLAYVLDMPALPLLLPPGPGGRTPVTPNMTMSVYDAYRWATGHLPPRQESEQVYYWEAAPLRQYAQIAEAIAMVGAAEAGRVYGPDGEPDPERARVLYGQHLADLARSLEVAAELGIALPPVPRPWLADMRARGLLQHPERISEGEDA
jgi:transcriptional regulator with XRE-family HTH domain